MPISAVDLFCGIGGLTKGLELSGIDVIAGIDIDPSCKYIYEKNNEAHFINEDLTSIKSVDIEELFPEGHLKVLVGCAPCQPFSKYTCRYRKDGDIDEKWGLLYSFIRLINEVRPDIVSMENVPNISKEKVFIDFVEALEIQGYKVHWEIVYCPKYGVPQKRKRLVLLASLHGIIELIPPLYEESSYPTVRQAIGDLPEISDGEEDENDSLHRAAKLSELNRNRIKQSTPGSTWRDWDEELKLKCHKKSSGETYPSVYGRMEWDEPAPTITTQFYGFGNGRFGHPEQNRALSLREGAILQSFPTDYIFVAKGDRIRKRDAARQIGNAVPVELGRAIGSSIQHHYKECIEEVRKR